MIVPKRALARLRLTDRDPGLLAERAQRVGRLGVDDAAAGDDERPLRAADQFDGPAERRFVGERPADRPHPLAEEAVRHVERLGLHVLRERERDRAGLCLVHEHAHRLQRRADDLLRPPDPVEVPRDRAERLVHRRVAGPGRLELLQHRVGAPRREHVTGEQQHGQSVHRRERGARDHVRRAGADRRRARERAESVLHPGVGGGRVHHALLAASLVIGEQVGLLVQRLADAGDVPMAEDAEAAREEAVLDAVSLDMLSGEEADERLRCGEPEGH